MWLIDFFSNTPGKNLGDAFLKHFFPACLPDHDLLETEDHNLVISMITERYIRAD